MNSKKRGRIAKIVVISLVILGLSIIVGCIIFLNKVSLNGYFDSWEKEPSDVTMTLFGNTVYVDGNRFSLADEDVRVYDFICVENGEIYFINIKKDLWTIYSKNIQSGDIKNHYSCNLPKENVYRLNEHTSDADERDGFMYYDGNIILKSEGEIISYHIADGVVSNLDKLPSQKYLCSVNDKQNIKIKNAITGEEKNISFSEFAFQTNYENELNDLAKRTRSDKTSYTERFFDDIYVFNNEIYVSCYVNDFFGNVTSLIFKYEPENEKAYFVDWCKRDGLSLEFSLIPTDR